MSKTESQFRVDRIAAPLRYSVTESIRNAIAIGHFKAGEHLPERELCEMTGVSRTLVREAMRQLESEGIVVVDLTAEYWASLAGAMLGDFGARVIRVEDLSQPARDPDRDGPHRGPFVARITKEQAEGIYLVRQELESLACRLFVANATEDQRRALKTALSNLKSAARKSDPQARLSTKNQFYDCLVEGANNEALGNCIYMLNSRITLLRATSLKAPGRIKESMKELTAVVDALMDRDAEKAAELARFHVSKAAEAAVPLIETPEE